MVSDQPNETDGKPVEDLEIRWAWPEVWGRALVVMTLLIVTVAAVPAVIAYLVGRWSALEGQTLNYITAILSAAPMSGAAVALRMPGIRRDRLDARSFSARISRRDEFAMIAGVIPTIWAVGVLSAFFRQHLALDFENTLISVVMAPILYMACINFYGPRLAAHRPASDHTDS